MNAHKFVAVHGIDEAKRVLDGAPDKGATHFSCEDDDVVYYQKTNNLIFFDNDYSCWCEVYFDIPDIHSISELNQVVKSVGIVESYKGIDDARLYLKRWFKLHSGCKQVKNARSYITEQLSALQQAIADYEIVESYKENQHV